MIEIGHFKPLFIENPFPDVAPAYKLYYSPALGFWARVVANQEPHKCYESELAHMRFDVVINRIDLRISATVHKYSFEDGPSLYHAYPTITRPGSSYGWSPSASMQDKAIQGMLEICAQMDRDWPELPEVVLKQRVQQEIIDAMNMAYTLRLEASKLDERIEKMKEEQCQNSNAPVAE
jgi:hypothetical protein